MKALAKRLDALEVGQSILSPKVKQWLGWPLSDTERAALDNDDPVDLNTGAFYKDDTDLVVGAGDGGPNGLRLDRQSTWL